jgi:hypothetical protein
MIPKLEKMYQTAMNYINIFQSKALQNLPKLFFFWFENKPSGNPAADFILSASKLEFLSGHVQCQPNMLIGAKTSQAFVSRIFFFKADAIKAYHSQVRRENNNERVFSQFFDCEYKNGHSLFTYLPTLLVHILF